MKLKIGAAMSNKLPKTIIDKQGKTITLCLPPTSGLANEYPILEEFYEDVRNHAGKTELLDIFFMPKPQRMKTIFIWQNVLYKMH